jgi:nitric oxide reductase NorQ protein
MNSTIQTYVVAHEPYYHPVADEVALFEAAFLRRIPLIIKGPTGSGKTRFVEFMAWKLKKPLITIACNEDLTASDLIGRFLLDATGTTWKDGPLTTAVRNGAICYLDEIVEARADAAVVIHPLADERRVLPIDKLSELVHAHPDFQLVMSYNPGYQAASKDLKESTRQRFCAIEFSYPVQDKEREIVVHEGGVDASIAAKLVGVGVCSRELRGRGIAEGLSTLMLVRVAKLISDGLAPHAACRLALSIPLSDDADVHHAINGFVDAYFGPESDVGPTNWR